MLGIDPGIILHTYLKQHNHASMPPPRNGNVQLRVGSASSGHSWSGLSNMFVPSTGSVSGGDLSSMLHEDMGSQHLPLIAETPHENGRANRQKKKRSYMLYHPSFSWGGTSAPPKPAHEYLVEQANNARAAGTSYAAPRSYSPPRGAYGGSRHVSRSRSKSPTPAPHGWKPPSPRTKGNSPTPSPPGSCLSSRPGDNWR